MDKKESTKILALSETVLKASNDVAVIANTEQEKHDEEPEHVQASGSVDHHYEAAAALEEIAQELDDLSARLKKAAKQTP